MSDQPFLSRTGESSNNSPNKIDLFRSSFLDLTSGQRRSRLSTARLITNDAIIPIITTPRHGSYIDLIANLNKRSLLHRSHSAPSVITYEREPAKHPYFTDKSNPFLVQQAFICIFLYLATGVVVFLISGSYSGVVTARPIDAIYFLVVTLCTIGYGDIVPDTTFTKLFTCGFILFGFGFVYILLNGLVTYICDRQEEVLLSTVDENRFNTMVRTYMIDMEKGRMRIRIKVALALGVVFICLTVGTIAIHYIESLSWVDSFYMAVTSVTTVGYGDHSFTTLSGRCFAIVWLLVSCLAVARAFLYLAELGIDKRNRRIARLVLQKKMTLGDLVAADLDNDGTISKAEFVIYKLKEMGKIAEKDIIQIGHQFDILDPANCGKISLAEIMDGE